MRKHHRITVALLSLTAAMSLLTSSAASGAIVGPGETIVNDSGNLVEPAGDVIASDARTVTFTYDPAPFEPASDELTYDIDFTSRVIRDPATQRLTFVYRFQSEPGGRAFAQEDGTFTVQGFNGFSTDVSTDFAWSINRSADGVTIDAANFGEGAGGLPYFVIATDATEFDSNGSLSGTARDEFFVFDPAEQLEALRVLTATFALGDTFQPIADDGNGGGGTPIPLPPAAWTGLAALFGGGAFAKARRVLKLRV